MQNRPGVKTSEFWVTVIAMASGALMEVFDIKVDPEVLAATFGPAAAFVVSRGISKIKTPGDG